MRIGTFQLFRPSMHAKLLDELGEEVTIAG